MNRQEANMLITYTSSFNCPLQIDLWETFKQVLVIGTYLTGVFILILSQVQAASSQFLMYLSYCYSFPALLTTLLLGSYSDKGGRKILLMAPTIGSFLRTGVALVVIGLDWPKEYLYLGDAFAGLGGGFYCLMCGAYSYVSDTTGSKHRTLRMALVMLPSTFAMGGAELGIGYWIKASGYFYPTIFVAGIYVVTILYIVFLVPETVHKEETMKNTDKLLSLKIIIDGFKVLTRGKETRRPLKLALLLSIFAIWGLDMGRESVMTLFELDAPLCWDSVMIGYFSCIFMISIGLGGIIMVVLLQRCLPDIWMLAFAGGVYLLANIYRFFVRTTLMMYLSKSLISLE